MFDETAARTIIVRFDTEVTVDPETYADCQKPKARPF